LEYFNPSLDSHEKNNILRILGFEGDYNEIDKYKIECLEKGYGQNISQLLKTVEFANKLSSKKFFPMVDRKSKNRWIRKLIPSIYWASCFAIDKPEFRELLKSKEWNSKVRKYIIK